jgi:hypothetical protein
MNKQAARVQARQLGSEAALDLALELADATGVEPVLFVHADMCELKWPRCAAYIGTERSVYIRDLGQGFVECTREELLKSVGSD